MQLLLPAGRPILALCVVLLLWTPAMAESGHRVIIFGDSLSDPGNYFIEFGDVSLAPFEPVPSAPYAIGGHHFSNGATWAEDATEMLHIAQSGKPALAVPHIFTNYAVGRARARPDAPVFSAFDLTTEVNDFLSDFSSGLPSDALYVIWIGADDINDAIHALSSDPSGATSAEIIQAAITAIVNNIKVLVAAGAKTFLIVNEPDLGLTPAVRAFGPEAQAAASALSLSYDGALDLTLTALGQQLSPSIHLFQFDVNSLFIRVTSSPKDFGLDDVEDSCLTFGVTANALCAHPNVYLFWDGIHPTRAAHRILADELGKDIQSILAQ